MIDKTYPYDEAPKSHTVVIPTFDMFLFFISWDMKVPVYLTFVSGTIYAGHPMLIYTIYSVQ